MERKEYCQMLSEYLEVYLKNVELGRRERLFAESLLSHWKFNKKWSDKQFNAARKFVVRIIEEERDEECFE